MSDIELQEKAPWVHWWELIPCGQCIKSELNYCHVWLYLFQCLNPHKALHYKWTRRKCFIWNNPEYFSYMALDKWLDAQWWRKDGRKEGNVLFKDTLNTFYQQLYGIGHMVKNHSDTERGNPLLTIHWLLFPISRQSNWQDSTYNSLCYTSCGALAGTTQQWIHLPDTCFIWDSSLSFQPVPHNWCTKGHDICCPVYGMVLIKDFLSVTTN